MAGEGEKRRPPGRKPPPADVVDEIISAPDTETNPEVSQRLGVPERTVDRYRARARRERAEARAEAVSVRVAATINSAVDDLQELRVLAAGLARRLATEGDHVVAQGYMRVANSMIHAELGTQDPERVPSDEEYAALLASLQDRL